LSNNRTLNSSEGRRFAESYERMAARIASIPADDLHSVALASAVATVLGALPEIRTIRARIAEELPHLALAEIDQVEALALALSRANTRYLTSCAPPIDLQALASEVLELRDELRGEVTQLVRRGRLDAQAIRGLTGGNGHQDLARDLPILVTVLRDAWPQSAGRCGAESAELERAELLAGFVQRAVGPREPAPSPASAVTDTRLRAFTLLVRTCHDVRRAVAYLGIRAPRPGSRAAWQTRLLGARGSRSLTRRFRTANASVPRPAPTASVFTRSGFAPNRCRTPPRPAYCSVRMAASSPLCGHRRSSA